VAALGNPKGQVLFVDSASEMKRFGGEVHCGTNAAREPLAKPGN
jgi:hypothetical protein